MKGLSLRSALEYYRDSSGKMGIKQVSALPATSFQATPRENYGHTTDVFWIKLKVRNPAEEALIWFVLLDYAPTDSLTLYRLGDGPGKPKWTTAVTGDRHHFSRRGYWYRKPNLKVVSPAKSLETLYFRLESRAMMELKLEAWDRENLAREVTLESMILGGFYMAMLVILVYNFILYFFVKDFYYIAYVVYIFFYLLFQLTLDGVAFQLFWPGAVDWASTALPFFIGLMCMGILYFSMLFLDVKKNAPLMYKAQQGLLGLAGFMSLVSLWLGVERADLSVRLAVIATMPGSIICLVVGIVCLKRRVRSARYYLLAWASLLFFGLFRGTRVLFKLDPVPFLSDYDIHIGSVLLIFLFSVALANRINSMRLNLGLKVRALNNANSKIDHSERKYRQLVESSDDIIFTLDGEFKFRSFNQALEKNLGYQESELLGKSIFDIFFVEREYNRRMTESIYIRDKLAELKKTRERVVFNLNLRSQNIHEPREMSISLEYIKPAENRSGPGKRSELDEDLKRVEILGKAGNISEDMYAEYLNHEKYSYSMKSYLRNAELLSQRLTRNLGKYLDYMEVTSLRIALRELLINAIEHGNLSISFDDKSEALEAERYFNLVQERQEDEQLRKRQVHVDYSLNSERVQIRIEDEGAGFDHQYLRVESLRKANAENLSHGRGLAMAELEFDEMSFNEKGNEVVLVKYFGGSRPTASEVE